MNYLKWFYEMYNCGKLSIEMYRDILNQEIQRKELELKEIKEEMERISKDN